MEEESAPQPVIPKQIDEIRKHLKTDRLIMGTDRTLKALRSGGLAKVFLSSNTKEETVQDVGRCAGLAGVEVVTLEIPNDELGIFCKKPYPLSVIGLLK